MPDTFAPDRPPAAVAATLAPGGRLRAAINVGNAVLAQPGPSPDEPRGVSVALARALARTLDVPLEFVVFDAAGKVTDAVKHDRWDVAFLAIDPTRAEEVAFTRPYVLIEGIYLVPERSSLVSPDEVDRDGTRVAVARGSAYDLHLSRSLTHAKPVRYGTGPEALEAFGGGATEVAAGVREPLEAFAKSRSGIRVLPGRFMSIRQAMVVPRDRADAIPYLEAFVEAAKVSGLVAAELKASGQDPGVAAPPGD